MAKLFKPTDEQNRAINEIDNHLQIIACAGSGKTEVISRRIATILQEKQDVKSDSVVAFTFTEKAAVSLKKRIASACQNEINLDGMYVGTIHGFCFNLLKKYTDKFRDFEVLDTVKCHHFVNRYYKECGMADLGIDLHPNNVNLFLQCIDKMIDDYACMDEWTEQQRQAFNKYMESLYSKSYIDFSLMIFETLRQMQTNIFLKEYLNNIKYLVVDEYQDVNDLQEKLIIRISDAGANICVVGDDDQTIYRFRGSNAQNMITFDKRYGGCRQVRLETNFRCASGIVDIADTVIQNNTQRISKRMVSGVGQQKSEILVKNYESEEDQYINIAKQIGVYHQEGIAYKDIAVLVRKGKHAIVADRVLSKMGIPTETDSAEEFFEGEYFKRFTKTLIFLTNIDKAALYECWKEIVTDDKFNVAFKYLRSCARNGRETLRNMLIGFCEKIAFFDAEDCEDRKIALEGFLKILDDYEQIFEDWQLSAKANGIIRFLENRAAEEYKYYSFKTKNPESDAVQIMTIHKSKGLEFHTVFLPELLEKEFPASNIGGKKYWHVLGGKFESNKDKYRSDVEDERKLFYVAVTRAMNRLCFCYHLEKKKISLFLKEANESSYIQIPSEDLEEKGEHGSNKYSTSCHKFETRREDNRDLQYDLIKKARQKVLDYYGTGAKACRNPAAWGEFYKWQKASDEEVLKEAKKHGFV